jgi:FkbH-like protein
MIAQKTVSLDYARLVRESRKLSSNGAGQEIRIALLSDAASQQFVPLLKTLFHENGVHAEFYEGAFDALELEALNPASGLYSFGPGVIVLANCTQTLRSRYYASQPADFLEVSTERMLRIWDALERYSSARVIQCNYPLPYERQFGNYDLKVPHSLYSVTWELNSRIALYARERSNILVCDVESIASYLGRKQWFDERLWTLSKTFCQLDCLPYVAQGLVEIVLSTLGRIVKCVILDLDNTLWGGVVGDDGPLGIAIGPHGDGEPFYHFQQFLLTLKKRGILLAVCSKNNRNSALQPFLENPGMALKYEDITVFIANFDNKADNIRVIRDTLGIGFDSMVFLDDNPFERNLVRQILPDVIVPELPEDPADYVRAVSELNLFESSSFSAEDLGRSELYQREAERLALKSTVSSIDEYLQSLDMRIKVARFEPAKIPRIAQLIQRSNQFNLTTHRYSEGECEAMMRDEANFLPLYASLSDRFGDHGLISVVVLKVKPAELEILDWLMSCRVLTRGVEQFLMNRVFAVANQMGLRRVLGQYIPTAKNGMVKEFYVQFGFQNVLESNGRTHWQLAPETYRMRPVYITEND